MCEVAGDWQGVSVIRGREEAHLVLIRASVSVKFSGPRAPSLRDSSQIDLEYWLHFCVGLLALDTVDCVPTNLKYSLLLASVRELLGFPLPD